MGWRGRFLCGYDVPREDRIECQSEASFGRAYLTLLQIIDQTFDADDLNYPSISRKEDFIF